MSYCVLPVYFRPGSLCVSTQAKQEKAEEFRGRARGGNKSTKPTGPSVKNKNVNNETKMGAKFGIWRLKCKLSRMQKSK